MQNKSNSKRQQYWLDKGYTQEQIDTHLSYERRKSKEARERKIENSKENKDLIKQIKSDLLNKTFNKITIIKINESTDGVGFWYHCFRKFPDGSSGKFKYFYWFENYSIKEFLKDFKYV